MIHARILSGLVGLPNLAAFALLPLVLVTALTTATAIASPGAVGSEYAINDRPLPPKQWWTSCTDASGRRATIVSDCAGTGCQKSGDIFLQRYDSLGNTLGPRVPVNDGPAAFLGFRVTCSAGGWVAAQWLEAGCYKYRVFDPTDHAAGTSISGFTMDCRTRPNVSVDDTGNTFAAWPSAELGQGNQIYARRFLASGQPVGDAVQVSDGTVGWRLQPKVLADDNGTALVAWLGQGDANAPSSPVLARLVGADGNATGAVFEVDTFGYGSNSDPALRRIATGDFEVAWTNPLEGGRVAREVLADSGNAAASAPPQALAPLAALPHFGAARIIDSYRGATGLAGSLDAGSGGTTILSDPASGHWRSGDDTRSWAAASSVSGDPAYREVIGSDGAGTWVALRITDASPDVAFSRSTDDGHTWQDLAAVVTGPKYGAIVNARVHGEGQVWVAAWSVLDSRAGYTDSVVVTRSTNGGVTWTSAKTIDTGEDIGRHGFEVAAGGDGTWIAMLADTGIRFLRSADDGKNWSAPAAELPVATCANCAASRRFTRVGLASDGQGNWLAIFTASLYRSDLYGQDGDVFVLRSSDAGSSWSLPTAVAPYAGADGSPDFEPSVATDGAGKWVATWTSHHPIGATDDLDSDVVVAVSTNTGATWSAPALLQGSMQSDTASDDDAFLTRFDGHWAVVWQSQAFSRGNDVTLDQIMVAAADATCGNGKLEVGEACDDANLVDDDGCDSNCTASGCGNGIVDSGETCDDGNHDETDACLHTCQGPVCGDGIVSGSETCDDGNTDDNDACRNTCGGPYCGDGVVQAGVEECDPGSSAVPGCTPDCKLPRCGDGYVFPRVEACDDGNTIDDDACPNDCSKATCGDGYTSLGWEECDPADPLYAAGCSADCHLVGLCGDANGDAKVSTADARLILQRAVGLNVVCPRAACDMDSSGTIGVIDAHMDLRKAVGIPVGDNCSIGTGTIVFWIEDPRPIGAFQFDVDYSSTGGAFEGSGAGVACVSPLADQERFESAFNDSDQLQRLTAGFIALDPFSGRVDLARCQFTMPEDRTGTHFAVRVVDATDPDGNGLEPLPLVGYRVE